MSQVAAKRRLHLRNERVKVIALFQEEGSVLGGTLRGTSEGFSIELSLDSDEPEQNIAELIQFAHRMCFTEYALAHAVPLTCSHRLNGKPMQVDSPDA